MLWKNQRKKPLWQQDFEIADELMPDFFWDEPFPHSQCHSERYQGAYKKAKNNERLKNNEDTEDISL